MSEPLTGNVELDERIAHFNRLLEKRLTNYAIGIWEAFAEDVPAGVEWVPREPVDVAGYMLEEFEPPEMLVEDWLVKGEMHLFYAEAESFKTWLALILALKVMDAGGTVLWLDEELGPNYLAPRLTALGADADVVRERFAYLPFPSFDLGAEALISFRVLLGYLNPDLVVFDTFTDFLVGAGLDENKGVDVTNWIKAFPEAARRLGVTQIVLDHTPKGGSSAVGSRAKRAKTKIEYKMSTEGRADAASTCTVLVELTKNTPGAVLPQDVRRFTAGGDGTGRFVWEDAGTAPAKGSGAQRVSEIAESIRETLKDAHPKLLSANAIAEVVPHRKADVLRVLKTMATGSGHPDVSVEINERGWTRYAWTGIPLLNGDAGDGAAAVRPVSTHEFSNKESE